MGYILSLLWYPFVHEHWHMFVKIGDEAKFVYKINMLKKRLKSWTH